MKKLIIASAIALCASNSGAFAELLINEDFNYAAGAPNGVKTNSVGLSGTWYGGAFTPGSAGTATFISTGLSLDGHFTSTGGALEVSNPAGPIYGDSGASVAIAAPLAGLATFYTSQLMQLAPASRYYPAWVVEQRFNFVLKGDYTTSSGRVQVSGYNSGYAATRLGGASLGNSQTTHGGLVAGTTYLMIGVYTGDGTNITSATVYFFDETSYAKYLASANESNATALLASDCLFSVTQTGKVALSSLKYLQFAIGGGPTGIYDAFRLGTDIGDVVNLAGRIPDPSAYTPPR